jgi:hypothetical protein
MNASVSGYSTNGERASGAAGERPISEYLETIALLQEEVVRLEQELQLHGGISALGSSLRGAASDQCIEDAGTVERDAETHAEITRLKAELEKRDETVNLLLEQVGLVEESRAASRSEWEQLAGWVAQLEERVAGQDEGALRELEGRLAAQERESEDLRAKNEQHRRAWELERQVYERELARLQQGIAQAKGPAGKAKHGDADGASPPRGAPPEKLRALEDENLRLRVQKESVEKTAAENVAALSFKLAKARETREELARQLEQVRDEQRRERLEYETTLAELRTRASHTSLANGESGPAQERSLEQTGALDSDLRVRALRQHLLEIHEREEEVRRENSLASRLSRLWNRTAPRA